MANCDKLLKKAQDSPTNLRYSEYCRLAECWGYEEKKKTGGSHQKYKHALLKLPQEYAMLTIQNRKGNVATYQVEQLLEKIEYIQDTFPDFKPE